MKYFTLISFLFLYVFAAKAQQLPVFSQYLFNTLSINPAYAGSHERLSVTAIHRKQWTALEGAPTTSTVALHAPLKARQHGVGMQLQQDNAGRLRQSSVQGYYAYTISLSTKASFSMGASVNITNYGIDDASLNLQDDNDLAFDADGLQGWLPNIGMGLLLRHDKSFLGMSLPLLLQVQGEEITPTALRQARHYFFHAGHVFTLNNSWKMQPGLLYRWLQNAPAGLDLQHYFIWEDMLWLGAGYRLQQGMIGLVQAQINEKLRIGYAYDQGMQEYRFPGNSHELMLNYQLFNTPEKMVSPRYF